MSDYIRHMFDFPNNDGQKPLCHSLMTGKALIRETITNVNCPVCIDLWERAQDKPDPFADNDFQFTVAGGEQTLQDVQAVIDARRKTQVEDAVKHYLVHECGEAFDSMDTALAHECNVETSDYWQILPESEAM